MGHVRPTAPQLCYIYSATVTEGRNKAGTKSNSTLNKTQSCHKTSAPSQKRIITSS